jgi:hypothetical protein
MSQGRKRTPRKKVKTKKLHPRMNLATIPAAVNTASHITSKQPKGILQTNTDRLIQVTIPAGTPRGSTIVDIPLPANSTPRMQTQSRLFQKWQVKRFTFTAQTQISTAVNGGYVMAHLRDPTMSIGTGEDALRNLTAVQGSQTSKNWQSTVLHVGAWEQSLFTANGNDPRLTTAGRLVMLVDGPPSVDMHITVTLSWTAYFSYPALQSLPLALPQLVLLASALQSSGASDGIVNPVNWNPATNAYTAIADHSTAFLGLPRDLTILNSITLFYRTPQFTVKHGGDDHIVNFLAVDAVSGQVRVRMTEAPSIAALTYGTDVNVIAWQGDTFMPVTPSEFTGTAEPPSGFWHASPFLSAQKQPMTSKEYQTVPIPQLEDLSKASITPHERLATILSLNY